MTETVVDPAAVESEVAPSEYPKPGSDGSKRRGRAAGASTPAPYRASRLKEPVERGYVFAGKVALAKDPGLGLLLMDQAEACAVAWDQLAKSNATVRKVITFLVDLQNKGGVAGAHTPFLLYGADRLGLLERVPLLGELFTRLIQQHVNDLIKEAIASGILEAIGADEADTVAA